jgi:cytochrome c-type biogenesis protein
VGAESKSLALNGIAASLHEVTQATQGTARSAMASDFVVSALASFLAGSLSFASPCVLPLVPGFLGYIAGQTSAAPTSGRRVVAGAVLFMAGFTVVFVGGAWAMNAGVAALQLPPRPLEIASGVVVCVLAVAFMGRLSLLQSTVRLPGRPPRGTVGAPLLGGIFALGWSPCIGPTLGTAMAMMAPLRSGHSSDALVGAALVSAYSMGLGLPFVLVATGWSRAQRGSELLRRHRRGIQLFGGALLFAAGLMLVTGTWADGTTWLRGHLPLPTPQI